MPVLLSKNGELTNVTTKHEGGGYTPVAYGKPLSIKMLTFFPGANIKDWGNHAELMLTSHVRGTPSNKPAPRRINMMLFDYDFKKAHPVRDYGGDVFGNALLYYTKAYAGQEIGITLRGTELDKINRKIWKSLTKTITKIGSLAFFTPAAPYLSAAGLATNIAQKLIRAINRNDRISIHRKNFFFDEPNQTILQSGRFLFWKGSPTSTVMKKDYRLTGTGDDEPNLLVKKDDASELFKKKPYWILQINAKEEKAYEDFEIGAGSAELLEEWGDKDLMTTIFNTVGDIAAQVNDARELMEINNLLKDLKRAKTQEEKDKINEQIKAHTELFSKDNGDLLKTLLGKYLK